jgi:predicted transcriptional regulator
MPYASVIVKHNFYADKVKNMLMKPEEITKRLQDRSTGAVAKATGIGICTISMMRQGKIKNPRYETLRKLSEYFQKNQ